MIPNEAHILTQTTGNALFGRAAQIMAQTSSKAIFDPVPGADTNKGYTVNGLNQYLTPAGAGIETIRNLVRGAIERERKEPIHGDREGHIGPITVQLRWQLR